MRSGCSSRRAPARPAALLLLGAWLLLAWVVPSASADGLPNAPTGAGPDPPVATAPDSTLATGPDPAVAVGGGPSVVVGGGPSRLSPTDPLNGGYLLVNMHGMLFHTLNSDVQEDVSYARWLGSGIIRVFATDSSGHYQWDGTRIGTRIADIAPLLRASHMRLIVALVNNHQAVPGELPASAGWLDNYMQLLLPFYTGNWRGAYVQFVHDVVSTVQARQAQDVVFAWELGNELHTPQQPEALMSFVSQASAQVRALDPVTPIFPGTMGANHVQPGDPHSPIARWLYCDAPIDAYTLHAYDWVSRARPGDMPIDWDLDNITATPCANGRTLPVIVEELGTSRTLAGVYTADDERARLDQELRQISFVRQFHQVVGFGVWDGESPRVIDRTFLDIRRGLSSYGSRAMGGGSCYDPLPDSGPGVRCQLEQVLRNLRFVRVEAANQWAPRADAAAADPLVGLVDPVLSGDSTDVLPISGWVLDPSSSDSPGVDGVAVFLGGVSDGSAPLASARLGLPRADLPAGVHPLDGPNVGFSLSLPLGGLPVGPTTLTLLAHTPEHGTWQSTLQIVIPELGTAAQLAPTAPAVALLPTPSASLPIRLEIQSPQAGDKLPHTFDLQALAPNADAVDVFMEPDRDRGGRLLGSSQPGPGARPVFRATLVVPTGSHTLYVHARSATSKEQVQALPIVVN